MTVILSHNSALEILRATPPQTGLLTPYPDAFDMAQATSSLKPLRSALSALGAARQRPAHVLVNPSCRRGLHGEVRIHQVALPTIPQGMLLELDQGLLCCGPELVFLQMASEASLVGAAVLGYELCGKYSHFSQLISGFYDRPALTSKAEISATITQLAGVRGARRANEALGLVLEGSRSPMEAVLAAILSLPSSLGGCGFMAPRLNLRVNLDQKAASLAGTSRCYLDLAWPDQMRAFEYDGATWHTDARADRRRREALTHMGWTVNVIDLNDISNHSSLMSAVSLIDGVIPRDSKKPIDAKGTRELLGRLLRATRFGLGLNAALFGVPVEKGLVSVHI